jgi:hypothetical protein
MRDYNLVIAIVLTMALLIGCGDSSNTNGKRKGKSPTRREVTVVNLEEYINFLARNVKAPQVVAHDGKQTHFIELVSEIQDVTVIFLKERSLPVDRENRSKYILSFTEKKRIYSLDDLYNFFKNGDQNEN